MALGITSILWAEMFKRANQSVHSRDSAIVSARKSRMRTFFLPDLRGVLYYMCEAIVETVFVDRQHMALINIVKFDQKVFFVESS